MQTLLTVFGSRPEAVKIKPLHDALESAGLTSLLISTGQQTDLLRTSPLHGATSLNMPSKGSPLDYAQSLVGPLSELIRNEPMVEGVVCQGDTSSAYAGALAAKACGLPLLHLEAGVRTHDLNNPWPEEFFRVEIDGMAECYFCATEGNLQNLLAEQHDSTGKHAWVTGNTGIDALYAVVQPTSPCNRQKRVLVTLHRRESHGGPLRDIVDGLVQACDDFPSYEFLWPVHPSPMVKAALPPVCPPNLRILDALPPRTFQELLASSSAVLTDSGGVSEEAAALGVPAVIARTVTDRPESVESGHAFLAGRSAPSVYYHLTMALEGARLTTPFLGFGNGKAATRIAEIIRTL